MHGADLDTVDVTDAEQVDAFVASIGRVDILVNNAGGVVGQVGRPLEEVSEDDWRAVVDANLTSTFLCTRAVAPGMKERGYGRIVNISSGAGRSVSLTGIQAYASAKAGQIGFTRQTAHELGRFGITVNSIAPGFVLSNPTSIAQFEIVRRGGAAQAHRRDRDAAARDTGGHRERRPLLRRRGVVVGDGAGDLDRWRPLDLLRVLARLEELLAIPSVSLDPAHAGDMRRAADWLAHELSWAGGRVVETDGHPVVLAEWLGRPGAPTILVYGHYDVQPPGDEAEWTSPPFEPTVRDGRIYARGATDDKGPVIVALETARRFHEQTGALPLNVRFLIEGEEEIGSPSLPAFLAEHRDELTADLVVSADGAMWRPTEPSVSDRRQGPRRLRPHRPRRRDRPALRPARRGSAEPEPRARAHRRESPSR